MAERRKYVPEPLDLTEKFDYEEVIKMDLLDTNEELGLAKYTKDRNAPTGNVYIVSTETREEKVKIDVDEWLTYRVPVKTGYKCITKHIHKLNPNFW